MICVIKHNLVADKLILSFVDLWIQTNVNDCVSRRRNEICKKKKIWNTILYFY